VGGDIPFGKPSFSSAEAEAVARVLRSGWVGMGPETLAFEEELAAHVQAPFVVSTNSCTSALQLSLLALGVGPGDEVIVPSLTWCSTANAALYVGATPVFCDIDPQRFCVSPQAVAAALTPRTRAVIPVHFGGLATDIAALRSVLPAGVHIIEDAAHALGARQPGGQPVGASGHLSCFSFYANKALSTGDGGAIALADASLAARLRSLRLQGQPSDAWQRYTQPSLAPAAPPINLVGLKANFTDLLAAVGRVQLRRQAEFAATRARVAAVYLAALRQALPTLQFQQDVDHHDHARHLFLLLLPRPWARHRNALLAGLRAQGIGASLHYAPLHRMPVYAGLPRGQLPQTEDIAARILTLPIGPCMDEDDALRVVDAFVGQLQRLASTAS
jgi:perosamine synthetase